MRGYPGAVMPVIFLVDYLLLMGANRLSGFPPGVGRCAVAAAVGAVYSGVCLLPETGVSGNPLWRVAGLGVMGIVAFGADLSALRRAALFAVLSLALGGIALQFGRGDFRPLAVFGLLLWILCRLGPEEQGEYIPVTFCYGGKSISTTALRDTGNGLRDPVTGEQVLVVSAGLAKKLTGLTGAQLESPLETLENRPIKGLRLIPYTSVGGSGMLLALRLPEVIIGKRRQSAVVAFAPRGFLEGERVQALTGGVL